jgi:hypothetical protein
MERSRGEWHLVGRVKVGEDEEEEEEASLLSQRRRRISGSPGFPGSPGSFGKRRGWGRSMVGSRAFLRDAICCCVPSALIPKCLITSYEYPSLDYESFLSQVKTGDIFLFEGKGGSSWTIQCVTGMRYSHVGMAVKMIDPNDPTNPQFMIWESTRPDGTYDFVTGGDKDGLRLVNMHEKLYEYSILNYSISYRPLTVWDDRVREKIGHGAVAMHAWTLIMRGAHIPYETNYVELANAHKRWIVGASGDVLKDRKTLESVFCSEGVMWFYRDAMFLSLEDEEEGITWLPRDFTPEDFAKESEGIPFAYSDPPQASFGGQYVVASRGSIDKGLRQRYHEYRRSQSTLARRFRATLNSAVHATAMPDTGRNAVRIDGEKLWKIDFGQNAYPLKDVNTGMTSVSLDKYT